MKNILDKNKNLKLYNKKGILRYEFFKNSDNYSWEYTYDKQGKILTYKNSNNYSCESTYDKQGNRLTYKNSDNYSCESTYDKQGNRLTFKNSNGVVETY